MDELLWQELFSNNLISLRLWLGQCWRILRLWERRRVFPPGPGGHPLRLPPRPHGPEVRGPGDQVHGGALQTRSKLYRARTRKRLQVFIFPPCCASHFYQNLPFLIFILALKGDTHLGLICINSPRSRWNSVYKVPLDANWGIYKNMIRNPIRIASIIKVRNVNVKGINANVVLT